MHAATAKYLDSIEGVEARCLEVTSWKHTTTNDVTVYEELTCPKNKIFRHVYLRLTAFARMKKWLQWADIVHYTCIPIFENARDLHWLKQAGKAILIEWVGSEIRDHDILTKHNPHFAKAIENDASFQASPIRSSTQRDFKNVGAKVTVCPEMSLYVDRSLFPEIYPLMQRVDLSILKPSFPDPNQVRPKIVHASTSRRKKGTRQIISVVEQLQKDYDFDFELIEGRTRAESLEAIASCDIYIDQLILGSHGIAALEAMGMGKPTLTYIMPAVFEAGLPEECTIVNTNPETLAEQLLRLLQDGALRNRIGQAGRQYVEEYHDVEKIGQQLVEYYRTLSGQVVI